MTREANLVYNKTPVTSLFTMYLPLLTRASNLDGGRGSRGRAGGGKGKLAAARASRVMKTIEVTSQWLEATRKVSGPPKP